MAASNNGDPKRKTYLESGAIEDTMGVMTNNKSGISQKIPHQKRKWHAKKKMSACHHKNSDYTYTRIQVLVATTTQPTRGREYSNEKGTAR